ncbi:MAG: HD domain-containing protein [Bacteroidaceae bacterium]|jgi:HD superfamily phosphohydrolase
MNTKRKIINDPVFGFINIPEGVLLSLIGHPYLQRLTRIRQLGFSPMVYPGALHTRFQHSLGAYFLTSEAVTHLSAKGNEITPQEAEAVEAAILMHDMGHGPFSHVLEDTLVDGISHEEISLLLMERINEEMNGALSEAIRIFCDKHPKRFLHQLVSSQLDMDRMDYLRRDSFYTGVIEGNIGSARLIKMLDVRDDRLVVEAKGIYSVENYLTARRLMYWQVYLHKTSVACERMLVKVLERAKQLARSGEELFASPALNFFLKERIDRERFLKQPECVTHFVHLDDSDIWTSLKVWCSHPDLILSTLSRGLVERRIFKVEVHSSPVTGQRIEELRRQIMERFHISAEEAAFFYDLPSIEKNMYNLQDDHIEILYKDGTIHDIAEASDMFNWDVLSKKTKKYYLCYLRSE